MEHTEKHKSKIVFTQRHIVEFWWEKMCKSTHFLHITQFLVDKRASLTSQCKSQTTFAQIIFSSTSVPLHCPIALFSYYFLLSHDVKRPRFHCDIEHKSHWPGTGNWVQEFHYGTYKKDHAAQSRVRALDLKNNAITWTAKHVK